MELYERSKQYIYLYNPNIRINVWLFTLLTYFVRKVLQQG